MIIYFAGSIRGGRDGVDLYFKIIQYLKSFGEVLTEHIGDKALKTSGERNSQDSYIYQRDINWILQSDIIIAEVTQPSLGVGYEIAYALKSKKNVVCLYQASSDFKLSAMIAGNKNLNIIKYDTFETLKNQLLKTLNSPEYK